MVRALSNDLRNVLLRRLKLGLFGEKHLPVWGILT